MYFIEKYHVMSIDYLGLRCFLCFRKRIYFFQFFSYDMNVNNVFYDTDDVG